MFENNTYTHKNLNRQEIRNFSINLLTAHPSGGGLFEGRVWQLTTDNRLYHYIGGTIRAIVNAEDLNVFGRLVGGHDASTGFLPTTGSGVDEVNALDLTIEAGDMWRITVAGTITGLASGRENLEPGDILISLIDDPQSAANFMAVQGVSDEVQNFTDATGFPTTGESGVIYIDETAELSYFWNGSIYTPLSGSTPNIEHAALGIVGFPATGDTDIIYIDDLTDVAYYWDGVAYVPLVSAASSAGVVLTTQKVTPIFANTPMTFAAEVFTAGISTIREVSVIDTSTGDKLFLREDILSMEVESNVDIPSITIQVIGIA